MRPSVHAWLIVAALWVAATLNYLDRQAITAVFPLLRSELHLSSLQLGLLSTVFLWVYGVWSPVCGYWGDRFGHRKLVVASLVVWSLCTGVTGLARNFEELAAARALLGVSQAFYLPAALAIIARHHGDRTRSLATGLHQSGLYLGIVAGGAGAGWLGQTYGWRFAFELLGMAGVLYAGLLALALARGGGGPPGGVRKEGVPLVAALATLVRIRGFVLLVAGKSLGAMAYWVVYTWLPLYVYERFGMSLAAAGWLATVYIQVGSFAGILAGGVLADRWFQATPRGRLLTIVVGVFAAGPFLLIAGLTRSEGVLILALLIFGIGRGFSDCNIMPVMCQVAPWDLRATGYGIYNLSTCIVGGLMAGVAGAVKDALGLGVAFQLSGVLLVASGVVLLRIRIPARKEETC